MNKVYIGGFVENIIQAKTKAGYPAACLRVKMRVNDMVSYVNVNMYDEKAELCGKIKRGDYVVIVGRLMNRKIGERYFSEVKGEELVLFLHFGKDKKELHNEGNSSAEIID